MTVVSNALGAPLVLRDAANPHTQYSLPTEVIAVKSGAESALEYFSVAILKNGNRISITRTCQAAADSVDPAALAPIEAIVQKIAIQLR